MYIELFFTDDLLMDFITASLAAALMRRRPPVWRLLAVSAAAAAAACVSAYGAPFFRSLPARALQLALVSLAIPGRGLGLRLRAAGAVLAATFAVGGCAAAAVFLTGGSMNNGALIGGIGLRAGLIGAAAASLLPRAARGLRLRGAPDQTAELAFIYKGRRFVFRGMVDTGNSLTEPLTGLPAAVVFCPELEGAARLAVPVRTAAGRACFKGLRPEKTFVNGEETDCVIAFAADELEAGALIPPELAPNIRHRKGKIHGSVDENTAEALRKGLRRKPELSGDGRLAPAASRKGGGGAHRGGDGAGQRLSLIHI